MAAIKLRRLPDRTPVKMTVLLAPELKRELDDYSEFYALSYGSTESPAHLVPAMLEAFLGSDRAFARRRKDKASSP